MKAMCRPVVLCLLVLAAIVSAPSLFSAPAAAAAPGADAAAIRDLETRAVTFVNRMADGQWEAATEPFDATLSSVAPPAKVREAWQTLVAGTGAFRGVRGTRAGAVDQYRIVFVTCDFERDAMNVKVVFDSEGKIAGFFFVPAAAEAESPPPSYARPSSFHEVEMTVGAEGWPLPGTLSLPNGDGPFPAVVLVHGSGPQDRDETIGPNRPFRDLAQGLASRGIAVLRYEKRTREHRARLLEEAGRLTVEEETVDDAAAAARALAARPEVDGARVFVLGHSLGGMLVPRIAAKDERAAGFIIMAGSTRPLPESVVEQYEYIAKADGTVDESERRELEEIRKRAAVVESDTLSVAADPADLLFGVPAAYWLDLRDYHPAAAAAKMTRPMLILQGGRDYQVTEADYRGWRDALAGHANATFKLYPTLNHLFMTGSGPSTPAEYSAPGHVDLQVVRDIAEWVKGGR